MRKATAIISLLTAAAIAVGAAFTVYASEEVVPVTAGAITAKASVLMELSTGQVLSEQNAHERLPISSLGKIMTVLLLAEAIDTGTLAVDDRVTCSEHAASMGGAQIWLKSGEQMTVDELLRAVIIGNANDAAVTLAEKLGNSEKAFVEQMNAKARQLGMSNTVFKNAAGFDEEGQYSTAYDMGLASKELMKHERLYPYLTTWMDDLRGGETSLVNNNKLIKTYKGIMGINAASKSETGGFSVAACAVRDGFGLIAIVLGSPSNDERFADATALLDSGFGGYEIYSPMVDSAMLQPVKVANGVQGYAAVKVESMTTVVIPKGRAGEVAQTITMAENLEAPVEAGQNVGKLVLTLDGKEILQSNVIVLTAIQKLTVSTCFLILLKALLQI